MEHGVSISSSKFHKLVGIAYASAQAIFKKLTTVISSQMGEETIAVSSADFAPGICKRSRETPARKHPVSEQEVIDSQLIDHEFEPRSSDGMQTEALPFALAAFIARPDSDTDYQRTLTTTAQLVTAPEENTILGQLSVPQRNVYEVLSQEPTYFDNLRLCTGMPAGQLSATLTILELEGLVQRMAGDRYVRCLTAQPTDASMKPLGPGHFVSESTRKTVTAALNFIRINFDGISRKYLQNYLAAYWCHVERSRWAVGSLLEECLRFGPVTFAEILAYVSPASVKVLPVPQ
jgi:DNA-binding MarR family transcriptional regulator